MFVEGGGGWEKMNKWICSIVVKRLKTDGHKSKHTCPKLVTKTKLRHRIDLSWMWCRRNIFTTKCALHLNGGRGGGGGQCNNKNTQTKTINWHYKVMGRGPLSVDGGRWRQSHLNLITLILVIQFVVMTMKRDRKWEWEREREREKARLTWIRKKQTNR